MKTLIFVLLLMLGGIIDPPAVHAAAVTCNTATIPVCSVTIPSGEQQVLPIAVPTSLTSVTPIDSYLEVLTVANTTASAITFLVQDNQGTPVAVFPTVSIAANTLYVVPIQFMYFCQNGFSIQAGGAGLKMYARWRQ